MKNKHAVYYFWLFLVGLFILIGLLLLAFSLAPYPTLKMWGDALSKDGTLESLTPELYNQIHLPVLCLGIGLLITGIFMAIRGQWARANLARFIHIIYLALIRLKESALVLFQDIRNELPVRRDLWVLMIIIAFAVFLRLVFINRPMEYDESYTFSEFARHSFRQVITDYHVPNNHVFHTILVRVSFLIFGNSPWAIRIPALLAGIALVPAIYFLAVRLYSVSVGWIAAAVTAALPVLVFYSVNARGYTWICLWTVLLLLLSDYVRRKRSPAAWALMVVVTALGFYTIPIMLYPFGIAVTWLLLSGLFRDISPDYHGLKSWTAFLFGFGFCAALLTILFYLPVFQSNGILSVFNGNTVVNSLSVQEFAGVLPFQISQAAGEWRSGGLPAWFFPLLFAGSILSLVFHRRVAAQKVPLLAAALLFLIPFLAFQRPMILSRVWLFLLPLIILWAAAGFMGLAISIPQPHTPANSRANSRTRWIERGAAGLALFLVFLGGAAFLSPYLAHPEKIRAWPGMDAEAVTLYFKDELRQGDVVIVSNDEDAQYWYYFDYYRIPETHIRTIKTRPFQRAYIISHPKPRRTIESVILEFGPDLAFFKMETLKPQAQIGSTVIYEIWPYQDAVDQAFGVK